LFVIFRDFRFSFVKNEMKVKRLKAKPYKFPFEWYLKDLKNKPLDKGEVFSTFACGGGSTMGFKLAGFNVLGCNEIDPRMMKAYVANHKPKYAYLEDIRVFKERKDLPKELYNLTILDGSPPCSNFSLGGDRGKTWGVEKKFKEGQAKQVIDTLFFDFIDVAKELQPKVVIAENVKGLLLGKAVNYLAEIYKQLDKAGYITSHYLLDASKMGVPQKRERVFVIALRKDIAKPFIERDGLFKYKLKLDLNFNEKPIPLKRFAKSKPKTETMNYLPDRFGDKVINLNKPSRTLTTGIRLWFDPDNVIDDETIAKIGTFPLDYKYEHNNQLYLTAMSVPPVMMAQIVTRIYEQILSKL
jgi:DNA (cytosine-5)-methyltransferase 1